jgi:hypothetical protein
MSETAANLEQALGWLKNNVAGRLRLHFGHTDNLEMQPLRNEHELT